MYMAHFALSVAYLGLAVVYPLGLLVAARSPPAELRARSVLIASVFVGIFYSHHGWVRAGPWHLAGDH